MKMFLSTYDGKSSDVVIEADGQVWVSVLEPHLRTWNYYEKHEVITSESYDRSRNFRPPGSGRPSQRDRRDYYGFTRGTPYFDESHSFGLNTDGTVNSTFVHEWTQTLFPEL